MCNEEIPPSPFSSLPEDPDEFLKENEKTSPSEFPMWVQIRENKSDSFLVPEIKIEDVFMSEFNEGRIEMDTESWLQSILQIWWNLNLCIVLYYLMIVATVFKKVLEFFWWRHNQNSKMTTVRPSLKNPLVFFDIAIGEKLGTTSPWIPVYKFSWQDYLPPVQWYCSKNCWKFQSIVYWRKRDWKNWEALALQGICFPQDNKKVSSMDPRSLNSQFHVSRRWFYHGKRNRGGINLRRKVWW